MDPKYGIYCGNTSIGFGKSDLRVSNSSQKHAKSYIGFPSSYNNNLYLPNKKSSLTLSGSHDSVRFKIPEWEAFEVIFSHKDHCSRKQINHSFSAVQTNSKPITHKKWGGSIKYLYILIVFSCLLDLPSNLLVFILFASLAIALIFIVKSFHFSFVNHFINSIVHFSISSSGSLCFS